MDAEVMRGYLNMAFYGIIFAPDLGDDTVRRLVDSLIDRRTSREPVEAYSRAFKAVLATGRIPPQTLAMVARFPEEELLDFLRRLDRHLDARAGS